MSVNQALAQSGGSEHGLSSAEARRRLKRRGPNELRPPGRFEALRELARCLAIPLVLILFVAGRLSAVFGQMPSSVVIAVMLIVSILLNFTQGAARRPAGSGARARRRDSAGGG